jgi:TPR repeat protein
MGLILLLCKNDKIVKKDLKKAYKFARIGTEKGYLNALCCLGYCYLNGHGVIQK